MNRHQVRIMRLPHSQNLAADIPLPGYEGINSAGLDLMAALPPNMPVIVAPGGRAAIPTGLAFALPPDIEGQVRSRTGLALRYGIAILNSPGTLDPDYRGELHVILVNLSPEPYTVTRGAQLVFSPTLQVSIHEISAPATDSETPPAA